jgi:hypothetical protein
MPDLTIEFVVKCAGCHAELSATVRNGDVYADQCDKCSTQTYKDGFKEGHDEGYQEGYDEATDRNS